MSKLLEYKSIDFYERNAPTYERERFFDYQGQAIDKFQKKTVVDFIEFPRNKKILDLGCGTGRFSIELLSYKSHVISFDPSESMLKEVSKKGNENLNLIQGVGHKLPFKSESFDGCICINVFDHIKGPNILLSEISRVLKKDGVLVFNFSNSRGLYFPISIYINYLNKSLYNDVYTEWHNFNLMKNHIEISNLKIEKIRGQLIFPKKVDPKWLFEIFRIANEFLCNSILKSLLGSVYVKAVKK